MSNDKITAFNFDASNIKPFTGFEPVAAGWYNVVIEDAELVLTEDGSGQRIRFVWNILDGELAGRKIFDGFNVENANPQSAEIGRSQLSAVAHAVNCIRFTQLTQLYNKPHQIKVGVNGARTDKKTGRNYEPSNSFKGAKPYGEKVDNNKAGSAPSDTGAPPREGNNTGSSAPTSAPAADAPNERGPPAGSQNKPSEP